MIQVVKNSVICADCLDIMKEMPENSIDAVVTDPPYALVGNSRGGCLSIGDASTPYGRSGPSKKGISNKKGFMGKEWDGEIPGIEVWQEALRVAKPGAHMCAFGGTRTHHRLMVAIEDAGWEIRDTLGWIHGQGFPKGKDISKAIDIEAGIERVVIGLGFHCGLHHRGGANNFTDDNWEAKNRVGDHSLLTVPATDAAKQWDGWGTALKPAWEPIILCRKPISEKTVAQNVLKWGTGGLNIDTCRILSTDNQLAEKYASVRNAPVRNNKIYGKDTRERSEGNIEPHQKGRFPANLLTDGSDEVLALFPDTQPSKGKYVRKTGEEQFLGVMGDGRTNDPDGLCDSGSAARFFYTAKADSEERNKYVGKNKHPTVKPVDLLKYLCRLITPHGGLILDPFAGSGSTGVAAHEEGFDYILIEIEKESAETARIRNAQVRLPV